MIVINPYRDSRLGEEARAHVSFIVQNFPTPKAFSVEAMRARSVDVHAKINEKLIGTFKGTEEERLVKISDDTGNTGNYQQIDSDKEFRTIRNSYYNLYTS